MDTYIRRVFEGEAPCDKCNQTQICKENEWACRAFSYYVLHGSFEKQTLRHPTRGMFNKIFKEDEKALKNYLKSVKAKGNENDLFD
jgi:hypothetical protein